MPQCTFLVVFSVDSPFVSTLQLSVVSGNPSFYSYHQLPTRNSARRFVASRCAQPFSVDLPAVLPSHSPFSPAVSVFSPAILPATLPTVLPLASRATLRAHSPIPLSLPASAPSHILLRPCPSSPPYSRHALCFPGPAKDPILGFLAKCEELAKERNGHLLHVAAIQGILGSSRPHGA